MQKVYSGEKKKKYETINLSVIWEQKMGSVKGLQRTLIPLEIKTVIEHQNNSTN